MDTNEDYAAVFAARSVGAEADKAAMKAALAGIEVKKPGRGGGGLPVRDLDRHADWEAAEALLRAYPSLQSGVSREAVVRQLIGMYSERITRELWAGFTSCEDRDERWAIGLGLIMIAGPKLDDLVDSMVEVLTDPQWGRSRETVADALPRIRTDRAIEAAIALIGSDPEIDGFLLKGFLDTRQAVPASALDRLDDHPNSSVRRLVTRARKRAT